MKEVSIHQQQIYSHVVDFPDDVGPEVLSLRFPDYLSSPGTGITATVDAVLVADLKRGFGYNFQPMFYEDNNLVLVTNKAFSLLIVTTGTSTCFQRVRNWCTIEKLVHHY
jgi:hypothetical protein